MYQAPRGTQDILPEEQAYRRYVEQKAAAIAQLYGYERIDTPVFEDASLFIRSVGEGTDIVDKETYTFTDRGNSRLTLRPEGTAPICRAYVEHGMQNLVQPVKLYYIAPIFRYDRPQAGRYRQHYQFGCEAFGEEDPALDAEVIDMAWQFFGSLGLSNFSLQLNSIGCKACRPQYIASLKSYYESHREELCPECHVRLEGNTLRLLDCKKEQCQRKAAGAPRSLDYLCAECREHFDRLTSYLEALALPFQVNHCLVRGLDYYTRTVFEIQPEVEGSQSTMGGGGRYDNLIEELGGKPTPAIGFGAGIERIIINLKRDEIAVPLVPKPRVFIAYIGDTARDEVVRQVAVLRRAGIGVIGATGKRSLRAQLRQANTLGVSYTVIIGEEELRSGNVVLRNMTTAQQETVSRYSLADLLRI